MFPLPVGEIPLAGFGSDSMAGGHPVASSYHFSLRGLGMMAQKGGQSLGFVDGSRFVLHLPRVTGRSPFHRVDSGSWGLVNWLPIHTIFGIASSFQGTPTDTPPPLK